MNRLSKWLVVIVIIAAPGCAKKETATTATPTTESSVITATRDVVNATGVVLRNAVGSINDAVYGTKK